MAGPAHGWRQDRVQSATGPPSVFLILSLPLPLFHYMCAPLLVCMTTIIIIIIGRSARISVDTKTQTQTNQLFLLFFLFKKEFGMEPYLFNVTSDYL